MQAKATEALAWGSGVRHGPSNTMYNTLLFKSEKWQNAADGDEVVVDGVLTPIQSRRFGVAWDLIPGRS